TGGTVSARSETEEDEEPAAVAPSRAAVAGPAVDDGSETEDDALSENGGEVSQLVQSRLFPAGL
ncbi:MAG: hypothetical protein AAF267_13060, partial [Deinococcota bacterium]